MTTLVIHAHPLEDSYSSSLREAVSEGMDESGVAHRLARLCDGAQPELAGVDRLVAVYPTWNGGMPAVMLDWLGRTLSPWVDGDADRSSSPLRTIERVSVVTTHGSTRFRNRLQGQPGRHTITGVVLPMCAPGASLEWLAFYKIDRTTQAARAKFVEGIRTHFGERVGAATT